MKHELQSLHKNKLYLIAESPQFPALKCCQLASRVAGPSPHFCKSHLALSKGGRGRIATLTWITAVQVIPEHYTLGVKQRWVGWGL